MSNGDGWTHAASEDILCKSKLVSRDTSMGPKNKSPHHTGAPCYLWCELESSQNSIWPTQVSTQPQPASVTTRVLQEHLHVLTCGKNIK